IRVLVVMTASMIPLQILFVEGRSAAGPSGPDLAQPVLQVVMVADAGDAAVGKLEEGADAQPVLLARGRWQLAVGAQVGAAQHEFRGAAFAVGADENHRIV